MNKIFKQNPIHYLYTFVVVLFPMTHQLYLEKDSDTIYEEFVENEYEEVEDDYRNNDRMDDMINRYGRY